MNVERHRARRFATAGLGLGAGALAGLWTVTHVAQPRPAIHDLGGHRVVITGGNAGIGKATAVALARGGAHVVITSRDVERGRRAVTEIAERSGSDLVEVVTLDLASLASVRAGAAELERRLDGIDALVHNAGALQGRRRTTADGFELTIGANHLGPFLLTHLLAPRLLASAPARVVVVSSLAHRRAKIDLDDLMWERRPYVDLDVYGASKLANLLFARELSRRLAGTGVTALALHPGTVASGFGRTDAGPLLRAALTLARPFLLDEERGASTTVFAAAHPSLDGVTGAYLSRRRIVPPSATARDDVLARRLWDHSAALVGLAPDQIDRLVDEAVTGPAG